MRVIAIEEHYANPALQPPEALANLRAHPQLARIQDKLEEVGAGRLADMDAAGIDMQVLSHTVPGAEASTADDAVGVVREANDDLAQIVAAHPDRFAGFAALPMRDPNAAAAELRRAVGALGFRGAMINGLIDGRFLDDPQFTPVLYKAADLGVPLYLHPSFPPPQVARAKSSRSRTQHWRRCWLIISPPPAGAGTPRSRCMCCGWSVPGFSTVFPICGSSSGIWAR